MPRARSAFDTVPLPRIVPAVNRARLRDVLDQIVEREVHLGARVAVADQLAVVGRAHAHVQRGRRATRAELVGRDRERRERGRRLALEEAEALGELVGDEVAQRDSRSRASPAARAAAASAAACRCGVSPRTTQTSDSKSRPHAGVAQHDRVARPEQIAGAALVDQRIGLERRRRLGAARLAHQDHVVEVRRAVDPLVRAGQRRGERARRRAAAPSSCAALERVGERAQRRLRARPSRRARPAASARWRSAAASARRRALTTTSGPSRRRRAASRASCAFLTMPRRGEPPTMRSSARASSSSNVLDRLESTSSTATSRAVRGRRPVRPFRARAPVAGDVPGEASRRPRRRRCAARGGGAADALAEAISRHPSVPDTADAEERWSTTRIKLVHRFPNPLCSDELIVAIAAIPSSIPSRSASICASSCTYASRLPDAHVERRFGHALSIARCACRTNRPMSLRAWREGTKSVRDVIAC